MRRAFQRLQLLGVPPSVASLALQVVLKAMAHGRFDFIDFHGL